jgi:hypothetical protein
MIEGLQGEILLAGVVAEESSALLGDMIANRAAEHGIAVFEGVERGAEGYRAVNVEVDFALDVSEGAEVKREGDADHVMGDSFRSRLRSRSRSRSGWAEART